MAARRLQAWWRRRRGPELPAAEDPEAAEAERRHRAAVVLQTAARRWLLARLRSPAWSQLLAHPRGISEERARALRREIEVGWLQLLKVGISSHHFYLCDSFKFAFAFYFINNVVEHDITPVLHIISLNICQGLYICPDPGFNSCLHNHMQFMLPTFHHYIIPV